MLERGGGLNRPPRVDWRPVWRAWGSARRRSSRASARRSRC